MAGWTYRDFEVSIGRATDAYQLVVQDPIGRRAEAELELPRELRPVEDFWARIGHPRRLRRLDTPDLAEAKRVGGDLFAAIFRDQTLTCLRSSLVDAERDKQGLRIRLRLGAAPELTELPWEYLYDRERNRFLALSVRTPVVRCLDLNEPSRRLGVKAPLAILVVISSPRDYPRLDARREWSRLEAALAGLKRRGLVTLERLERGSLAALQRRLRGQDLHVIHFIGHGGFDQAAEDGAVVFEDDDGCGRPVSSESLGILLRDHPSLRLAFLNACDGARAAAVDPFSGVAQTLVQQGLQAVIAMQAEITDESAAALASELYKALADNYPIDACLGEARKALAAGGNVEWGVPVLYLRSPDGHLFDVERQAVEPSPTNRELSPVAAAAAESAAIAVVKIFVGCSREDGRYLDDSSLWGFLNSLESERFELWSDRRLAAGDLWRREVQRRLAECDVALVLLSQAFLDSFYGTDPVVVEQLRRCRHLLPVVVSPCEWQRHDWLRDRRVLPVDLETLEEHYDDEGRRKRLFLEIRHQLRRLAARVHDLSQHNADS